MGLESNTLESKNVSKTQSTILMRFATAGAFLMGTRIEQPDSDDGADSVQLRLKRGAQKLTCSDEIQIGAARGDLKRVKRAMKAGATATCKNRRGLTPLMLAACSSGKEALEVLKELLVGKGDVNALDVNNWTALHHACRNGKTEVFKYFVQNHADPTAMTQDQKTTMMLATHEGKVDLIKELLKFRSVRAQIVLKDAMMATALHYACKDGFTEIARLLIEHNAKVHIKDIDGRPPLMWACENGKLDVCKVLYKKRAEVEMADMNQRSCLMYACLSGYEGVALWLVSKNADPCYRDSNGETPLNVADEMGLSEFKRTMKARRMELEDAD